MSLQQSFKEIKIKDEKDRDKIKEDLLKITPEHKETLSKLLQDKALEIFNDYTPPSRVNKEIKSMLWEKYKKLKPLTYEDFVVYLMIKIDKLGVFSGYDSLFQFDSRRFETAKVLDRIQKVINNESQLFEYLKTYVKGDIYEIFKWRYSELNLSIRYDDNKVDLVEKKKDFQILKNLLIYLKKPDANRESNFPVYLQQIFILILNYIYDNGEISKKEDDKIRSEFSEDLDVIDNNILEVHQELEESQDEIAKLMDKIKKQNTRIQNQDTKIQHQQEVINNFTDELMNLKQIVNNLSLSTISNTSLDESSKDDSTTYNPFDE